MAALILQSENKVQSPEYIYHTSKLHHFMILSLQPLSHRLEGTITAWSCLHAIPVPTSTSQLTWTIHEATKAIELLKEERRHVRIDMLAELLPLQTKLASAVALSDTNPSDVVSIQQQLDAAVSEIESQYGDT